MYNKTWVIFKKSVIPCTNGILIRPKLDEILSNRLTQINHNTQSTSNLHSALHSTNTTPHSSVNSSTDKILQSSGTLNGSVSSSSTCNFNTSNSYNLTLSYIVNIITNEIVEIKFADEMSRNQWATSVHTHITPFIGTQQQNNLLADDSGSTSTLRHQNSNASNSSANSNNEITKTIKSSSNTNTGGPLLTANTYRCNSNIR